METQPVRQGTSNGLWSAGQFFNNDESGPADGRSATGKSVEHSTSAAKETGLIGRNGWRTNAAGPDNSTSYIDRGLRGTS